MALPFIAGLAVGGLVVVAFNNKKKIKEVASAGFEKSKEVAGNLKDNVGEKIDKITSKKDTKPKSRSTSKTSTTKTAAKPTVKKRTTKTAAKKISEQNKEEK